MMYLHTCKVCSGDTSSRQIEQAVAKEAESIQSWTSKAGQLTITAIVRQEGGTASLGQSYTMFWGEMHHKRLPWAV